MKLFCPRCGQEQLNNDTRFCSRCGFLMDGMAEIVMNGALPPKLFDRNDPKAISPRKKGVKQGGMLMLSGVVLVPLLGALSAFLNFDPTIVGIAAIITFLGGFVRIIFGLIFESGVPVVSQEESLLDTVKQNLIEKAKGTKALPPEQSVPASSYIPPEQGKWRDTNDLVGTSVTENTTKLLDEDEFSS